MRNFVSGYEYTGQNADLLEALGFDEDDAFVTFKQAIKLPGMNGSKMKGLKAAARLIRFEKKVKQDDDQTTSTYAKYFSVFDVKEVLKRAKG